MPIKNDREYRSAQAMQASAEDSYIVEGYATTFNDPYELYNDGERCIYEQIDARALDGADMSDVIMQYDHSGKVFARLSNGTLQIIPDERGLKIRADLGKSAAARDLYEEIKSGLITKMSWAFTVGADEFDKKTMTRTIRSIRKVYDVSAVSMPANPSTDISARSYANGVIEAEKREALEVEKAKARIRIILEVTK